MSAEKPVMVCPYNEFKACNEKLCPFFKIGGDSGIPWCWRAEKEMRDNA